ncbi:MULTISPECIES: DUF6643 family protein [unclassified Streptomyces]|uniref:DUF6643 family protein n=1 Tax=unclassified Streptomyces TaxID=2593676 RepID=UPI000DD5FA41|nr:MULTISPECIES: DUF6643 family protein [unclassified Streptomyces]QZZ31609.1 hypothetical protein A7X85_40175 [Streptomyces sp. ST1015]
MTSPRSTYGGGYYSSASFPDTPIYDSLVAERGTPQIAPIRVPAAYDVPSMPSGNLPALPSALPALPAGPSQAPYGYPQAQQPAPLQQAPAAYVPPQGAMQRGYPAAQAPMQPQPGPMGGGTMGGQMGTPMGANPMAGGSGYEAMRPAAPRPNPAPYQDPYNQQQQYRGY